MTGDQFAQLRFELNWTQQEVADRLGVTRFTVSRWEGQEEIPRMAELALRYLARDLLAEDGTLRSMRGRPRHPRYQLGARSNSPLHAGQVHKQI